MRNFRAEPRFIRFCYDLGLMPAILSFFVCFFFFLLLFFFCIVPRKILHYLSSFFICLRTHLHFVVFRNLVPWSEFAARNGRKGSSVCVWAEEEEEEQNEEEDERVMTH